MTNRKRTVGINIRVTPQEKKRIVRFAKKCRLSVSEYIRQLAEGYTPQQLPGQELYEVLWELQKLQDDYNAENLNRFTTASSGWLTMREIRRRRNTAT